MRSAPRSLHASLGSEPLRRAALVAVALGALGLGLDLSRPADSDAASARGSRGSGPTVEIHGRVALGDGTPLEKARMTLRAASETRTTCDDSGRFRLTLRLPTVATLERGAWNAQLDGAARGWRIIHVDGEPSLGLELTLDRAAGGMRVLARSNDERLAALAAAAVARAESRTLEGVRFTAIGGERSSIPPSPNMTHVAGVAIESPGERPAVVTAEPSTPAPAKVKPERAVKARRSRAPSARPSAARADSIRRANAAIAETVRRANTAQADSVRRAFTAQAESARRTNAAQAESIRRAIAARADSTRRATAADGQAANPPRTHEPRPANPISGARTPNARVHPVDPEPPQGPSSPPVVPRSNATPPEPPGPVVNPPRAEPMPDPRGCSCRFDGTVELVRSSILDRPEQVVLRLADWPAVADTVELFMGAPRAFRLARVPCGSRRVLVERLDSLLPPARIVTGQSMKGFGCVLGELVQPRIVIALDPGRRRR